MKVHIANRQERHDLLIKLVKDLDRMNYLTQHKTEEDFNLFDSIENLYKQVQVIRQLENK